MLTKLNFIMLSCSVNQTHTPLMWGDFKNQKYSSHVLNIHYFLNLASLCKTFFSWCFLCFCKGFIKRNKHTHVKTLLFISLL